MFERDEAERVTQRDEIRDTAAAFGQRYGEQDGVDEILNEMGLDRMDLFVSAHVEVLFEQRIPDTYMLRIGRRRAAGEGEDPFTDWRGGYNETGVAGHVTLNWRSNIDRQFLIEDKTVLRGADCYCDAIRAQQPDESWLADIAVGYDVPDGTREAGRRMVGCSGEYCPSYSEWSNELYG